MKKSLSAFKPGSAVLVVCMIAAAAGIFSPGHPAGLFWLWMKFAHVLQ